MIKHFLFNKTWSDNGGGLIPEVPLYLILQCFIATLVQNSVSEGIERYSPKISMINQEIFKTNNNYNCILLNTFKLLMQNLQFVSEIWSYMRESLWSECLS